MALLGGDWFERLDDDDRPLCFGGDWYDNIMNNNDDICLAISPSMRESFEEEKEQSK
jgi:hypothetical protein